MASKKKIQSHMRRNLDDFMVDGKINVDLMAQGTSYIMDLYDDNGEVTKRVYKMACEIAEEIGA